MHYKVWDDITYPFPNFNGCTVEVWERISNFIPHLTGCMITYPCCRSEMLLCSVLVSRETDSKYIWYQYSITHYFPLRMMHAFIHRINCFIVWVLPDFVHIARIVYFIFIYVLIALSCQIMTPAALNWSKIKLYDLKAEMRSKSSKINPSAFQ